MLQRLNDRQAERVCVGYTLAEEMTKEVECGAFMMVVYAELDAQTASIILFASD